MNHELKMLYADSQKLHVLTPAFFFSGKGSVLHKTTEGMYRSLSYQLIASNEILSELFLQIWEKNNPYSSVAEISSDGFHWHVNELQMFLEAAIRNKLTPLVFLIDALDECRDSNETDVISSEARDIVYFFDGLMTTAQECGAIIDVCISCRSWFKMDTKNKGYEIIVDQCNQKDLQTYAERRLSVRHYLDMRDMSKLANDIVGMSSGIFLWVKLVIDMLLHDLDTGKTLSNIRLRLSSLPRELEHIFRELLVATERSEAECRLATKIFQWVIFSNKNLRLREWHHILPMIQEHPPRSLAKWRPSCTSDEQLIRRIQAATMGLIDVSGVDEDDYSRMDGVDEVQPHGNRGIFDNLSVGGGAGSLDLELGETRTVQVIHDSVRTFFLRDAFAIMGKKYSLEEAIGQSHLMIIDTCLNFLNIAELDSLVVAKEHSKTKVEKSFKNDTQIQIGARAPRNVLFTSHEDSVPLSTASNSTGELRISLVREPALSISQCILTLAIRIISLSKLVVWSHSISVSSKAPMG